MKTLSFALTYCSLVLLNSTAFSAPVTGDTTNNPSSYSELPKDHLPLEVSFENLAGTSNELATFTSPTHLPVEPSSSATKALERRRRDRERRKRGKAGIHTRLRALVTDEHPKLRRHRLNIINYAIQDAAAKCSKERESTKDCASRLRQELFVILGNAPPADSLHIASDFLYSAINESTRSVHGSEDFILISFVERRLGKENSSADTQSKSAPRKRARYIPLVKGEPERIREARLGIINLGLDAAAKCPKGGESTKQCRTRLKREIIRKIGNASPADSLYIASNILDSAIKNSPNPIQDSEAPFVLDSFVQRWHRTKNHAADTLSESPPTKRRKGNSDSFGGTSDHPAPVFSSIDLTQDSQSLKRLDDSVDTTLRLGRN